jgi:hypothetical protein
VRARVRRVLHGESCPRVGWGEGGGRRRHALMPRCVGRMVPESTFIELASMSHVPHPSCIKTAAKCQGLQQGELSSIAS